MESQEEKSPYCPSKAVLVLGQLCELRNVVCQYLSGSGIRLVPADEPVSALERLRKESFHALIANFHEPGIDHACFYREATRLQPGLTGRFLYVTDNLGVLRRFLNECPVLAPPFGRTELCQALHDLFACPVAG